MGQHLAQLLETIHDVGGDLTNKTVVGQTEHPIRAAEGHNLSPSGPVGFTHDHYRVAVAHLGQILGARIAIKTFSQKLEVALVVEGRNRLRILADAKIAR